MEKNEAMTMSSAASRPGLLAPLAAAVRSGALPALRLAEESLRRIEAARDLNAVVAVRPAAALADAEHLDAAVRGGADPGPLAGLPLLVKDIEDAAGLPTTFGSLLRAAQAAARCDGVISWRLRAAGAILVGKTNVPEFAFEGFTANRLFGATGNPWVRGFSPGGSSGGSAAALAAGLAPLATATDVGGSVRIPAALCGLVGLKPTSGLIGRDPGLASPDLNGHGPLAATVADTRLLLGILVGPVIGDPAALPRWRPDPRPVPGRILSAPSFFAGPPLPATVEVAFRVAVDQLSDVLGARLEHVELDEIFPEGYEASDWFRIVGVEQAHALGRDVIDREAERLDPVFLGYMRAAFEVTLEDHTAARRRRYRYTRELDELLGTDAVLVTPTLTVEGWSADGLLAGRTAAGLPGWVFNTEPPNLTGHPAISVPAGHLPNGLPFGLQIVGPRFGDWMLLDLAEAWETGAQWPLVANGCHQFGAADVA